MTATEMEDLLKNLDLRTSRIEQILPTLATKDDLKVFATKEDLMALKTELQEGLAQVDRRATVMFESVKADTQMIAEHLADLSQRLPPRA